MKASQIPVKFPIPFGNSAVNITAIPQASQIGVQGGRASLTDGFPPLCFIPEASGGIPPWGADFNGLFNQITAWNQWQNAGGMTVFDAIFSAAVGGYPQGATIASATAPGTLWVSLVDNNTQNPDTTAGNPGWVPLAVIPSVQNSSYISADDTGTADNYVATPLPLIQALQKYQRFQIRIANANLTTTPRLNIIGLGGALGANTIVHPNGTSLQIGELAAGMVASFIYDGSRFQFQTPGATIASPLRMISLVANPTQTFPNGQITKVNCFSQVQNTLQTSTWDGANLIIGTGESGLWSLFASFEFGNPNITAELAMVQRTRSGVQTSYFFGSENGFPTAQPGGSVVTDLQVGDIVNWYAAVFGGSITMASSSAYGAPNPVSAMAQRIIGIQGT